MKTRERNQSIFRLTTEVTEATMRKEALKRLERRATMLGVCVGLVSVLVEIIWIIIGFHTGWLNTNDLGGWLYIGLPLCAFSGFVVSIVYYTITAWRDL